MMRRKRLEITIESHERIVFKRSASPPLRCPVCGMLMITPNQAATFAQVSVRTIFNWVEANHVHFVEGSDESLMICTAALSEKDNCE
jgi:hypothetical protein